MKKQIYTILVSGTIICCLMSGCGKVSADVVSVDDSIESLKDVAQSITENMGQEYTENKDGTYTCNGVVFQYKLTLKGMENGAVGESIFVVLTNNENITHNDVFQGLISATLEAGKPKFVMLGYYANNALSD